MLTGFDPDAAVAITTAAEAAYAAAQQRAASTFKVRGGSVCASGDGKSWKGEGMWMLRASVYGSMTRPSRGGYGYFDTVNGPHSRQTKRDTQITQHAERDSVDVSARQPHGGRVADARSFGSPVPARDSSLCSATRRPG
jgi:hypothetical protein